MPVNGKALNICSAIVLLSIAGRAAASDERVAAAAKNRETALVRVLLQEKAPVNAPLPDGATALHWAVHWDDADTVELLIRAGANVNAVNDLGVTPLSLACINGNAATVAKLLQAGANANAVLPTGESPLMTASRTGNVQAVSALLAHGADANAKESSEGQTALMWAAVEGHAEIARVLIESGADVHARTDRAGFTPLLFAAQQGARDAARILLANGADVNEAAADGSSVLLVATVMGHWTLTEFLLDRGADPNAAAAGYTALHWAAGAWESELSGSLGSESYLWMAALGPGKLELVKALLAHGANPNARLVKNPPRFGFSFGGSRLEAAGATPFLLAADAARVDIMRLLLASGADPSLMTNDRTTPLMMAAGFGQIDSTSRATEHDAIAAVELMMQLGGDVTAVNNAGETALHGAAYAGWNAVVQFLVDSGATVNAKNQRGWTPLTIAEGYVDRTTGANPRYHPETAALLRELGGVSDSNAGGR
jgi:ankyrin repeat protein